MRKAIGKYEIEGGGSCPEQYDVFLNGKEIGYLRLRHGSFSAYLTEMGKDWERVYQSEAMVGDGCFEDDERDYFLTAAINAIDAALAAKAELARLAV